MAHKTLDGKAIDTLRDLPDLIPVIRDYYEDWSIRVFNREEHECRNYLSPNRRDFYKILLVTAGAGVFTLGLNTYYIDKPSIVFIHPNDIISWKKISTDAPGGYYCLFRKELVANHPQLKATIDRYGLFTNKKRSLVRVADKDVPVMNGFFARMLEEELSGQAHFEDAMQAYIQLMMIESTRMAEYPEPDHVSDEFRHVHQFFTLLEQETTNINYQRPIR